MKLFLFLFLCFCCAILNAREVYGREVCSFNFDIKNKFSHCETLCEFKFNENGRYGYCKNKIKKIVYEIELGKYYTNIKYYSLINDSIIKAFNDIRRKVEEYDFKLTKISPDKNIIDGDYFFHIYIDSPDFNNKQVKVNIFKKIGSRFDFGVYSFSISKENFDVLYSGGINSIVKEVKFDIFYGKDDV